MKLVAADAARLDQILDETYPIWNEGLTRQAYGNWNEAQVRTPWGRERLQRLALVDDRGATLASCKRYRFDAVLDGAPVQLCGVGAVFTPEAERGRGYARTLIDLLIEQEAAAGIDGAVLFSEIGPAFYEPLGFASIPQDEVTLSVKLRGGAPAVLVRAAEERDYSNLAAIHDARVAGARFALRRDPAYLQYAMAKRRLLAGLGPPGLRHTEFWVTEEGMNAVAYVVLTVDANGWYLEDAGDRDPAGARLGAMLQVLLAREPSHEPPRIRGVWPAAMPTPPQTVIATREPAREVLMVRGLARQMPALAPPDVFWWHVDYF